MKKGVFKKLLALMCAAVLVLGLAGCSISLKGKDRAGDGKEKYADLFPDAASRGGKAYKYKTKSYKFSLTTGVGEMTIYVDTTNGYDLEVVSSPAGFHVKDKEGNTALYGVCMDKEQYAEFTADCTQVKTVNGRDFLYKYNSGDGSEDYCSYMADCGLECGLVLEVHDGASANVELVAFRGDAIFGSSSDVYFYQGHGPIEEPDTEKPDTEEPDTEEPDTEEPDTEEPDTEEPSTDSGSGEVTTNSSLSSEIESALSTLETDYKKVKWGAVYSFSDEMPGIVISVTPCLSYSGNGLIVAITNLYDEPISFTGSAAAKGKNDEILGDTFIYEDCIGSGSTIIKLIDCGSELPDGRVRWEDCSAVISTYTYTPWAGDYKVTGNPADGYLTVDYSLYSTEGEACSVGAVGVLLLDENGYVLYATTDYVSDIEAGATISSSASFWGEENILSQTKNVAMFANTVVK